MEPLKLGKKVRAVRRRNNRTLEEASARTGLARSTLSKIENEKMSPTFEVLRKLTAGLDLDIPQLFVAPSENRNTGRRTITRAEEGHSHPTPPYEHELLGTEISNKRMIPFKSRIRARDLSQFAGWAHYDGEEFFLVLEGGVVFHTEFYEPVTLGAGDSAYYDRGMGHACTSASEEDALIFWISTPS